MNSSNEDKYDKHQNIPQPDSNCIAKQPLPGAAGKVFNTDDSREQQDYAVVACDKTSVLEDHEGLNKLSTPNCTNKKTIPPILPPPKIPEYLLQFLLPRVRFSSPVPFTMSSPPIYIDHQRGTDENLTATPLFTRRKRRRRRKRKYTINYSSAWTRPSPIWYRRNYPVDEEMYIDDEEINVRFQNMEI